MLLSRTCTYGLRAAARLAVHQRDDEGYLAIRVVSKELGISFAFLTKIFQQLTEAGLVESLRGPKGGVRLTRPAAAITLLDIVVAIDGAGLFEECVLGLPGCGDRDPCPLHEAWTTERASLSTMLADRSLGEVAASVERDGLRLAALP